MSGHIRFTRLLLFLGMLSLVPFSVHAQLAVANGNYDGNWNNTTFMSMGAVSMNIMNDDGTMMSTVTLDLDGFVFGNPDPTPVVLTGPYPVPITNPLSVSTSVNHPQLGAVTLAVDPTTGAIDGQFLVDDVLGPTTGVARMNVTGTINTSTYAVDMLYAIYFTGSPGSGLDCDPANADPDLENADACGTFALMRTNLPVELTTFEGLLDGDGLFLTWATETETNNAGFAIEHAAPYSDFSEIAFVEGAGTTLQPQEYHYLVYDLEPGTHLFRLRQLDLDGTDSYSNTLEFRLDLPDDTPIVLHEPFPMPAQNYTVVRFLNQVDQKVRLRLFDVTGRRIRDLYQGSGAGLETEAIIPVDDLPGGYYLLRLESQNGNFATRPIIIQK